MFQIHPDNYYQYAFTLQEERRELAKVQQMLKVVTNQPKYAQTIFTVGMVVTAFAQAFVIMSQLLNL